MKLALFLSIVAAAGTAAANPPQAALPAWVISLVSQQPQHSRTVIEESIYRGRRAFLVMPSDRAPDSGNEHVLHSEDGKVICEFGGFAGHVTVGSCDIAGIKFVRTVIGNTR
jgi:hypothetical protein